MVRVYEMKLPQDRIQEMTSNLTNFVFIASQDAFWNTLSKFLIMDVRNSVVFYVSLICSLLVTLLVRFSSVAAFRHKNVIRKVFPVTKSPHASADVIKEEVLFTGKSAQENTEETEANEKMLLEAGMVFKSGKMKEIERRITSRTSRRVTLIVVPEDSSRTTEDKVCCARVMIDVDSSRASERLVSEDAVLPQIDVSKEEEILPNYTGSLVQNPTSARRASLPLQNQEHVDHDHGRRDMAYLIADDAGLRDERLRSLAHLLGDPLHHSSDEGEILDTFQPMSEEAVYGFQSVCSIYSEYGARTAATIMTLLLTTTPPQYNWSSCRGSLATENILIRSAISLVAGVVIDVLSVYLDRRFGKVDYARGLEELCELHVSLLALFHLALTTSSVAGLVIFVQPGIFVTDQCFREGRRSWIWKIGTT
ncbi:hypothetical protein BC829DRAFT_386739 [Chytridium lagenaria]|nr:hypothetical protein BC829DRAFT_386739 [Chytridium lagenaria]